MRSIRSGWPASARHFLRHDHPFDDRRVRRSRASCTVTQQSRRSAFHPHLQSCLRAGCGRQICDMHHTHMKVRCLRQSQWCRSDIHREPPGRHSEVIAEHRAPSRSSSQSCTSTGPFANAQQHCAAGLSVGEACGTLQLGPPQRGRLRLNLLPAPS